MMQFGWLYRERFETNSTFVRERQLLVDQFQQRHNLTKTILSEVLSDADATLYTCDPRDHVEDETYKKVYPFMFGTLEWARDSNCELGRNELIPKICPGVFSGCSVVGSNVQECLMNEYGNSRRVQYYHVGSKNQYLGKNRPCKVQLRMASSPYCNAVRENSVVLVCLVL